MPDIEIGIIVSWNESNSVRNAASGRVKHYTDERYGARDPSKAGFGGAVAGVLIHGGCIKGIRGESDIVE